MKVIDSLGVLIRGDLSKLPQDIDSGVKELNRLSAKADDVSSRLSGMGNSLSLKLTAPVVAFGTLAVKKFADFEASMIRLGAHSKLSSASLGEMSEKVQAMSKRFKMDPTEMASSLREIMSIGYDTSDALVMLSNSAALAKATMSSVTSSSELLTNTMKTYNMEVKDAGKVTDQLAAIWRDSGVPTEALATSFSFLSSTAKNVGLTLPQLGAALVSLRRSGMPAEKALAGLQRLMQMMAQSKGEMESVYKGMGYESIEAAIAEKGLIGVLEEVKKKSGDTSKGIVDLGFRMQALTVVNTLTSNQGKMFVRTLEEMNNASGTTSGILGQLSGSTSAGFSKMKASMNDLSITFGKVLAPSVAEFLSKINSLLESLSKLSSNQKTALVQVAVALAAIGPTIKIFAGVTSIVSKIAGGFALLTTAITSATVAMKGFNLEANLFGVAGVKKLGALGGVVAAGGAGYAAGSYLDKKTGLSGIIGNFFAGSKDKNTFGISGGELQGEFTKGEAAKSQRVAGMTTAAQETVQKVTPKTPIMTDDELKAKAKFEELVFKYKLQGMTTEEKINALVERRKKLELEIKAATVEKGYELKEQALDLESQIASLYSEMGGEPTKYQYAGAATKGSVEAYSASIAKDAPMSEVEKNGKEQTKELKKIVSGVDKMQSTLAALDLQAVTI